jgi:hypothetical protein
MHRDHPPRMIVRWEMLGRYEESKKGINQYFHLLWKGRPIQVRTLHSILKKFIGMRVSFHGDFWHTLHDSGVSTHFTLDFTTLS